LPTAADPRIPTLRMIATPATRVRPNRPRRKSEAPLTPDVRVRLGQ